MTVPRVINSGEKKYCIFYKGWGYGYLGDMDIIHKIKSGKTICGLSIETAREFYKTLSKRTNRSPFQPSYFLKNGDKKYWVKRCLKCFKD